LFAAEHGKTDFGGRFGLPVGLLLNGRIPVHQVFYYIKIYPIIIKNIKLAHTYSPSHKYLTA
jgi:hypothetical protein